jgi:hypothetical protein
MEIMDSFLPNSDEIFDEVRGIWVAATPEEQVRQHLLNRMIHALHYPKQLIAVEKELKELPHLSSSYLPLRRIDVLCYGKDIHPAFPLYPLLLIECKKEAIDAKAIDQLTGYNSHVKAYFIALANREEEHFGYFDRKTMKYVFHAGLPAYQDLLAWLKR